MDWANFLDNMEVLKAIRILVFMSLFFLSTSYLIPRGIVDFYKWKETQQFSTLSKGVSLVSTGVFILIYFLGFFIFDSIKKVL
jgi:hypothetical protein